MVVRKKLRFANYSPPDQKLEKSWSSFMLSLPSLSLFLWVRFFFTYFFADDGLLASVSPVAPLHSQLRLATLGLQAVVVSGAGHTAKKGKGKIVPRSRKTDHFRGLAQGRRGRKNVRRRSKISIGRSNDFEDWHKRKIESIPRFRTRL